MQTVESQETRLCATDYECPSRFLDVVYRGVNLKEIHFEYHTPSLFLATDRNDEILGARLSILA